VTGDDIGVLVLAGLVWTVWNQISDRWIRARCHARKGVWGLCREPVHRRGDRCPTHVARRERSLGP
jgi:hypothetical protein